MKKKSAKYWIRKNDKLWSELVKIRAKYKCEICGKGGVALNSHHWHTGRHNKHTRWMLENGVCLCVGCHFKAHNEPVEFLKSHKKIFRADFYMQLDLMVTIQARSTEKIDHQLINIGLTEEIKRIKE